MKKTGKKCIGNFTTDARKALSLCGDLFCQVDESGAIYVTNGFVAFRMSPAEYATIVQPVSCCEAGNWCIRDGKKVERSVDLIGFFKSSITNAEGTPALDRYPFNYICSGGEAAVWVPRDRNCFVLYSTKYISAFAPGYTLHCPGRLGVAVAYRGDEPFAIVLPIRCKDDNDEKRILRSVRAFFANPNANEESETARLNYEIYKLKKQLTEATAEADKLRETASQQTHEIESANSPAANETAGTNNETAGTNNETAAPAPASPTGLERFSELYKSAWLALSERHDEIPHFAEIAASYDRIASSEQGRRLVYAFRSTCCFNPDGPDLVATRSRAAFAIALSQYKKELASATTAA